MSATRIWISDVRLSGCLAVWVPCGDALAEGFQAPYLRLDPASDMVSCPVLPECPAVVPGGAQVLISRNRRWAILFPGSPVLADRDDRGGLAVDDGGVASSRVIPVLVDPAKAGDTAVAFTLPVEGDGTPWLVELRNGVILTEPAPAPMAAHVALTASDLADFVLGRSAPQPGSLLATLDSALDRSGFAFLPDSPAQSLDDPAAEAHLLGQGSQ
jgi:hypothetical protein